MVIYGVGMPVLSMKRQKKESCMIPPHFGLTMSMNWATWRSASNQFTRLYFDEYHSHVPKAEPAEDYDDRNALYAL